MRNRYGPYNVLELSQNGSREWAKEEWKLKTTKTRHRSIVPEGFLAAALDMGRWRLRHLHRGVNEPEIGPHYQSNLELRYLRVQCSEPSELERVGKGREETVIGSALSAQKEKARPLRTYSASQEWESG